MSDDATADATGKYPLDRIVGAVASVRVLRELSRGGEHAPPHLAIRTGLSRPAVREALIRLEQERIIERVGQGRNILYRLKDEHPLARRIVKLFKSEAKIQPEETDTSE